MKKPNLLDYGLTHEDVERFSALEDRLRIRVKRLESVALYMMRMSLV
jgi:hypothetical protein